MSEIQDEAYSEAMDEISRLKEIIGPLQAANMAYSREVALSEREIEQLKQTATDLQRECEKRGSKIAELEKLLIRAADALENLAVGSFVHGRPLGLIDELRKAAK